MRTGIGALELNLLTRFILCFGWIRYEWLLLVSLPDFGEDKIENWNISSTYDFSSFIAN